MGKKLLVIDDSATIRKLLEISFRNTEITLELAANGQEGIARALGESPDAILLDYVLPDMRATDVASRLARDPRASRIPILVMSGKADSIRELFRGEQAVVDFVGKPFSAQEIQKRVRAAMAKAQAMVPPPPPPPANLSTVPAPIDSGLPQLKGELVDWPVTAILAQLDGSRTGEMHLTRDGMATILFVHQGEILLVSCDDALVFRQIVGDLPRVSAAALSRASREQEMTGKPLHVTLAEESELPPEGIAPALYAAGRRLLAEACAARRVAFEWHERVTLPLYVEAYGRRIPAAQIVLDRLREVPPESSELDGEDGVFERAPAFSAKVRALELGTDERRVLALVNGRTSIEEIAARALMDPEEVRRALHAMRLAGLVEKRSVPVFERRLGGREDPVLAVDPDREGFLAALGALLGRRKSPVPLVTAAPGDDLPAAVLRAAPRLLVVNATMSGHRVLQVARSVRFNLRLARLPIVAVLDAPDEGFQRDLYAAGVDAVLVKPVRFGDIETFLNV